MKTMVAKGHSASQVGISLGCSRNAALSKAFRLGLQFHGDSVVRKIEAREERRSTRASTLWSEQELSKASKLWNEGWTSQQIGIAIGKTGNAVNAKAQDRRDLFPFRNRATHQVEMASCHAKLQNHVRLEREAKASERAQRGFDSSMFAIPDTSPVRFIDLTAHQCKFPISAADGPSNADMPCCRMRISLGSYCSHHAAIARGEGTRSERVALDGIGGRKL
ncbi:hypothetical protein JTP94_31660 [Rhizobium lusitanum]|nr:hypothetical protein [Rhizobium lusitanum]